MEIKKILRKSVVVAQISLTTVRKMPVMPAHNCKRCPKFQLLPLFKRRQNVLQI